MCMESGSELRPVDALRFLMGFLMISIKDKKKWINDGSLAFMLIKEIN
jgi:hypothetical protein